MPTYCYRCECGRDFERWRSIHTDSMLQPCECGRVAVKRMVSPRVSVYATPSKGAEVRRIDAGDAGLTRDLPAYRELRRQGYQPRKIDGAAVLARDASDPLDIEMGSKAFVDPASYERAREVKQALAESAREDEFAGEYGKAIRGGD